MVNPRHKRDVALEGFETVVAGPLGLDPSRPATLTWLAKAGPFLLGSIQLRSDGPHVAQICDLQFSTESLRTRQAVTARLLSAIAEYARDHGILKLSVHRNSRFDWVATQLSRFGFSDASGSERMQFYQDLYRPTHRAKPRPTHQPDPSRLVC